MTVDPRTLAADLRDMLPETWPRLHRDAADAIDILVPLHDAWLQAKPPCPTCGGSGDVLKPHPTNPHLQLADNCRCEYTDHPGVQPFDKWTAGLVALSEMRSDIIRVAQHVRSHDDRPYEESDRLLRQIGDT